MPLFCLFMPRCLRSHDSLRSCDVTGVEPLVRLTFGLFLFTCSTSVLYVFLETLNFKVSWNFPRIPAFHLFTTKMASLWQESPAFEPVLSYFHTGGGFGCVCGTLARKKKSSIRSFLPWGVELGKHVSFEDFPNIFFNKPPKPAKKTCWCF